MTRGTVPGLAAALLVAALAGMGCGEDNPTTVCPGGDYRQIDSPEAVLHNLIESYRRREIAKYAELLDPDFRFYFQNGDEPPEFGRGYWTPREDSTGTRALFNSPEVSDISINLTYQDAEPAIEVEMQGTMKIRVTPMKLTVDDVDGTTYLVEGDIQDMYFRQGTGVNSERWYLYEWHDLRGGGGIGAPDEGALAGATGHGIPAGATEKHTWGKLKQQYQGDL